MIRKGFFLGVFFGAILWGLISCGTVQIVSEKKTAPEPVRQERPLPEKTTPKSPPPPAPAEKGFFEKIIQKIAPPDSFSRSYPVEFAAFHAKANSALQEYARAKKGNSFQISRLGSDEVVLRGVFVREGTQERYGATLSLKPAGAKKSQMEIKLAPAAGAPSSGNPEDAAREIFSIIEKSLAAQNP
jgi:hypothetical protein